MLGSKAKGARKNGAISGRFPEMSADFPAATTRLSSSRATLLSSSYPRVRASLWLYGRALNRDFGGCPSVRGVKSGDNIVEAYFT